LQHLADLEQRLSQDFLFGQNPLMPIFPLIIRLWFIHELAESPLLQGHPRLLNWMARMKGFGHGTSRNKLMRRKPYKRLKQNLVLLLKNIVKMR
jgi:glutathione S-transferase